MSEITYQDQLNLKPKTWMQRNWKWFVPATCLGSLIVFAAFFMSILLFVFGFIKSADVYKTAFESAKNNPTVIETLGSPVEDSWYVSGSVRTTGSSGHANITIPIHGPNGKAKIYAIAQKSEGKWFYTKLVVVVEGTEVRINLLTDSIGDKR